jgi:hypothetical protein
VLEEDAERLLSITQVLSTLNPRQRWRPDVAIVLQGFERSYMHRVALVVLPLPVGHKLLRIK